MHRVTRIPETLAIQQRWFVTEPGDGEESALLRLYSPFTLSPLQNPSDYSDLAYALETWENHEHWFDGVAFRVTAPWLMLTIGQSVTPAGRVTRSARDIAKNLCGYWEISRNGHDLQGILWSPQGATNQAGIFAGHAVHVCGDGICSVTLQPIPGCG